MQANLKNVDQHYIDWLKKCRRLLGIPTEEVAEGDWRFDWHLSYVVGCKPYEAVEDARAELRDRGIER